MSCHTNASGDLVAGTRWVERNMSFARLLTACALFLQLLVLEVSAQTPWEYDPYRVHVWLCVESSFGLDRVQVERLSEQIVAEVQDHFGPAATVSLDVPPNDVAGEAQRNLEGFDINELIDRELVLASSRKSEHGKEIRTLAAVEEFDGQIPIAAGLLGPFQRSLKESDDPALQRLGDKLVGWDGPANTAQGVEAVAAALMAGELPVGMIPKIYSGDKKLLRTIPYDYPFQLQNQLDAYDKIAIVLVEQSDALLTVKTRQIDCVLRTMTEVAQRNVASFSAVAMAAGGQIADSFVPYTRLERSAGPIADVRVRAGELLDGPDHPAYIGPGDVLVPMYRINETNGRPKTIQAIPWTYLVAFDEAASKMQCAIYSGTKAALIGRPPSRRLIKLGVLAKPQRAATELQLVALGTEAIMPGSGVYRRTPGTEDLEFVGRTDWRGVIRIEHPETPLVHFEVLQESAEQPAAARPEPGAPPADGSTGSGSTGSGSTGSDAAPASAPKPVIEPRTQQANEPLYIYYIKNGTSLLARLPVVTGLYDLEVARLPDDSRRLQAEGLIKGLENQIIDTVLRRRLLFARIEKAVDANKRSEAESLVKELRAAKDYKYFSDQLNAIQSRILAGGQSGLSGGDQRRIDRLFGVIREAIQQYLQQDSLLRDAENLLR